MTFGNETVIIDNMSNNEPKSYSDTRRASTKSLSAAKRDALWLHSISNNQDARALSDLFEIYGPKLKGWLMARGVGNGTAEDIVQDVMIKVWTKAGSFDPAKASFAT
mgnify:FL=1